PPSEPDPSSAQKIALPLSDATREPNHGRPSGALGRGAFADHQLKAEVEHRLLRATALDRVDHHGDGMAAHFIAIGAHAGERWHRRLHVFQVVEADDGEIAGNRYL